MINKGPAHAKPGSFSLFRPSSAYAAKIIFYLEKNLNMKKKIKVMTDLVKFNKNIGTKKKMLISNRWKLSQIAYWIMSGHLYNKEGHIVLDICKDIGRKLISQAAFDEAALSSGSFMSRAVFHISKDGSPECSSAFFLKKEKKKKS